MRRFNPLFGGRSKQEWAEDHGYWHVTCKTHGSFWTDSTQCPYCPILPRQSVQEASETHVGHEVTVGPSETVHGLISRVCPELEEK